MTVRLAAFCESNTDFFLGGSHVLHAPTHLSEVSAPSSGFYLLVGFSGFLSFKSKKLKIKNKNQEIAKTV